MTTNPAGYMFGKYIVTGHLGRGGMAAVYLAHDPLLDRRVAIKVILPHLTGDEDFVARFRREARLIASLRHAHIVQIFDFDVIDDQPFMVMEYLAGETLKARLAALRARGERMALTESVLLLSALAGALDYAHGQGAIHRDIKPANILFTTQGEPVLGDFGIAKLLDQTVQNSLTGGIVGTPAYLSPEQAAGKPVDSRSDLYSLGVVAYELATGRVPFQSDSASALLMQHLHEPPPPPRSFNSNLPLAVEQVILQALAKEPNARFVSVGEFAQALRTAMRGKAQVTGAPDDATIVRPNAEPPNALQITEPSPQPPQPMRRESAWVGLSVVTPRLVARAEELNKLEMHLNHALNGRGGVCLIRGEAGSGKTALIAEFARRSQAALTDLMIATGNCNAQSGFGDPYLPFRELLAALVGLSEPRLLSKAGPSEIEKHSSVLRTNVGRILVNHGPDLMDIFVPSGALVEHFAGTQADRSEWLERLERAHTIKAQGAGQAQGVEQRHVFEQYTNVLKTIAAERPLLLAIDDLQWADAASIELLFHLGRRVGASRILLIGAYRPEDVALGRDGQRHPLDRVLNELKRVYGEVEINLRQAQAERGRQFVDALLDSEPNCLDPTFRQALLQHTNGHALFTVELLRNMQERGDLIMDESGQWTVSGALDWDALSPRVEGVIAERIGRLTRELQDMMSIASVEGEDFTAEVVARVQQTDERDLIRRLSQELDRQHRLVGATGRQRVDGRRLSHYHFLHNLFQRYLYNRLDEVERSYMHEDIGRALEELYDAQAGQVAVQLAWHFDEAGLSEKARGYLRLAGERALRHYAPNEAIAYLQRAAKLAPETEVTERYHLLLALEAAHDLLADRAAQQHDLDALAQMVDATQNPEQQCQVALRQANYAEVVGEYATAAATAERAIALAEMAGSIEFKVVGYLSWGRALLHQSEYAASQSILEQALALARNASLRQTEADILRSLGLVAYSRGNNHVAAAIGQEALALHQALGDRRGEGHAFNNLANILADQGNAAEALHNYELAMRIYREIGDQEGEAMVLSNLGMIASDQGNIAEARNYFEQALQANREAGARGFEANTLLGLAMIYLDEHNYDRAHAYYMQTMAIHQETGNKRGEYHILQQLGRMSVYLGDYARAQAQLEEALQNLRSIGDQQRVCDSLVTLGILFNEVRDDDSARQALQEALQLALELGDPWEEASARTELGRLHANVGVLDVAQENYRNALQLWHEQGRPDLALNAEAGLARIAMQAGDLAQARQIVDGILAYLATHDFVYVNDLPVYLTCYLVLAAAQDARADTILNTAYARLQERSSRLPADAERQTYLTRVSVHREIVRLWQGIQERMDMDQVGDVTVAEP